MKRAVSLGPSFTVLVAIGCWMLSSRLADGGLHELGDADKQAGSLMNDPEETADGDASYDPEKADSNTEEATEAGEKKSQAMEVATKKAEADHAAAFRAREAQEMARVAAAAKARTDAASKETGEKEVHAKAQPPTNQDPTIQNPWALPAERKQPKTNQEDEAPKEATARDAYRVSSSWSTMYERKAKSEAESARLNEKGLNEVSELEWKNKNGSYANASNFVATDEEWEAKAGGYGADLIEKEKKEKAAGGAEAAAEVKQKQDAAKAAEKERQDAEAKEAKSKEGEQKKFEADSANEKKIKAGGRR